MEVLFTIPVHNERDTLEALTDGITRHIGDLPHRILFIDDGSTDDSYDILCRLQEQYPTIDLIRFRRNFGKSQALAAAFAHAQSDIVIMMDADLQDDPAEIPKLLDKLKEGFDLVCGWKADRHDPWHKTVPSRFYNALAARIFGLQLHDINTGFKAMRLEVAKNLPLYGELHRMIAPFAHQMGYRIAEVPVRHHPRRHGYSKYGFERFTRGALDILTTWFLTQRGQSPNHVFGLTGCTATASGLLALIGGLAFGIVRLLLFPPAPETWRAQLLALLIWLVLSVCLLAWGSLAFAVGLLGEMLVRRLPPIDPNTYIAETHFGQDR